MGEKPDDWRTLPLCALDHLDGPNAQHRSNERSWWAAKGIYPPANIETYVHRFQLEVPLTSKLYLRQGT